MIEKEEKLTLEGERINDCLYESINLNETGLTPDYMPPGFKDDCITIEEFDAMVTKIIYKKCREKYGKIAD